MPTTATALTVADPDVHGPLAVFPVFGPPAVTEYRSFAEAAALGARLQELPGGASVNQLLAVNPLDVPVLFYEGEEVRGAQQDRTLDVSILVPAGGKVHVPVTCVEHGRWDGGRHGEAFKAAPQASHPELRRLKNRASRATGAAAAAQGEVWEEVARMSAHHGADGNTGALRDVFEARGTDLGAMRDAVTRRDGQLGAVCCVGGKVAVLDWVGRPDVFAALHGPLVAGYALDASEHPEAEPPTVAEVQAFLAAALAAPRVRRPSPGLGEDVRFASREAEGASLVLGEELVTLTAFAGEQRVAAIRRPSRRR